MNRRPRRSNTRVPAEFFEPEEALEGGRFVFIFATHGLGGTHFGISTPARSAAPDGEGVRGAAPPGKLPCNNMSLNL